tara:strand:- start:483 stop:767 length:285 start_codon:yes stop_codon:yes gene_type:complete
MKITKQRLKEIIKEELEGSTFEMSVDELAILAKQGLKQIDAGLLDIGGAQARLVEQHDGGEFVHLKTKINELYKNLDELKEGFIIALGNYEARL